MNLFRQLEGLLGRGIGPTQNNTNTEKRGHTSIPRAGYEPMIPVFERPKTLRALVRAVSGTGFKSILISLISFMGTQFNLHVVQYFSPDEVTGFLEVHK